MMKKAHFALLLASFFALTTFAQSDQVQGRVFWKGMVDAKVQLSIKGDKIETKTIGGKEYPDGVYSFTSPLPDSPVTVELAKKDGRGTARVIQQPTEDNKFTAIVEVVDDKGGAKEYQLEIFWH